MIAPTPQRQLALVIAAGAALGLPLAALLAALFGFTVPAALGYLSLMLLSAVVGGAAWELGMRPVFAAPASGAPAGAEPGAAPAAITVGLDPDDDAPDEGERLYRLIENNQGARYAWPADVEAPGGHTYVDKTLYTAAEIADEVGTEDDDA